MRRVTFTSLIALSIAIESLTAFRFGTLAQSERQAEPSLQRQEVWQREFRYSTTRGEVWLSGNELDVVFTTLLPDDVVNIRAVPARGAYLGRYAFGFLRYAHPEHRAKVEHIAGLDPTLITRDVGKLVVERPVDPRIRLFADIEVPTGARVKLVTDQRVILQGQSFKGACVANRMLWPPHPRLRYVVAHAMLRHYLMNEPGAFVPGGELIAPQALSWSEGESGGPWIALDIRIGRDGRVLRVEPLIGSPEIAEDVVRRVANWSFDFLNRFRDRERLRTTVVCWIKGAETSCAPPRLR
jgi:hypothetical protein